MRPSRSLILTSVIALAGAAWGTGTAVVATVILVGQEGMYLPTFLALGPLLLVTERLPIAVSMFVLVPIYYAGTTAALWQVGRSRTATVIASALYLLLLLGPVLGMTGHLWSEAKPFEVSAELHKSFATARDVPGWFGAMTFGLIAWHLFAWWRLGRFWCSATRPAAIRWSVEGVAAALFGGAIAWWGQVLSHAPEGSDFPTILTLGPVLVLEAAVNGNDRAGVFALAGSAIYGLLGFLVAAARERRAAFWPAALAVGTFIVGTLLIFGIIELSRPGRVFGELVRVGSAARSPPGLAIPTLFGLAAWNAFVGWNLWRGRKNEIEKGSPSD